MASEAVVNQFDRCALHKQKGSVRNPFLICNRLQYLNTSVFIHNPFFHHEGYLFEGFDVGERVLV